MECGKPSSLIASRDRQAAMFTASNDNGSSAVRTNAGVEEAHCGGLDLVTAERLPARLVCTHEAEHLKMVRREHIDKLASLQMGVQVLRLAGEGSRLPDEARTT